MSSSAKIEAGAGPVSPVPRIQHWYAGGVTMWLLAAYNFAVVGVALVGLYLERRHPKVGIGLMLLAAFALLNLFVGSAILFVPLIVGIYGVVLGLPALAVWYAVRRFRRRRASRRAPTSAAAVMRD